MALIKVAGLLCVLAAACAGPAVDTTRNSRNVIQTEGNLLDIVYQDCLQKDTFSCLKYKVLSFADKVVGINEVTVANGVQIVKSGEPSTGARSLSNDASIQNIVLNKVQTFLETHTLKVDLSGKDLIESARGLVESDEEYEEEEEDEFEEGRKKKGGKKKIKKIKKIFGPIMHIVGLKAMILAKLALLGIGLMALKALFMGKIALLISGFIGLKKLLGQKHGGQEHHPIHTESHVFAHESLHPIAEHGHGYGGSGAQAGWGRSADAQQLAYNAYTPETQQ